MEGERGEGGRGRKGEGGEDKANEDFIITPEVHFLTKIMVHKVIH